MGESTEPMKRIATDAARMNTDDRRSIWVTEARMTLTNWKWKRIKSVSIGAPSVAKCMGSFNE